MRPGPDKPGQVHPTSRVPGVQDEQDHVWRATHDRYDPVRVSTPITGSPRGRLGRGQGHPDPESSGTPRKADADRPRRPSPPERAPSAGRKSHRLGWLSPIDEPPRHRQRPHPRVTAAATAHGPAARALDHVGARSTNTSPSAGQAPPPSAATDLPTRGSVRPTRTESVGRVRASFMGCPDIRLEVGPLSTRHLPSMTAHRHERDALWPGSLSRSLPARALRPGHRSISRARLPQGRPGSPQ